MLTSPKSPPVPPEVPTTVRAGAAWASTPIEGSIGWSGILIVRTGDRTGEGIYSDSDELEEDEMDEEVEELISTSIGRAILPLGAKLVMLDRSEEEDIKGSRRALTGGKGRL